MVQHSVDGFMRTAGARLKRQGLVKGRRRARWHACGTGPFAPVDQPNAVWSADHKGWFRTKDKLRCEPLTVMESYSRSVLGLAALGSAGEAKAWPVFEGLFHETGLPQRLRSDNSAPFASAGFSGLTPLSVRFVKRGIALERSNPGKPTQNGRHERFHLTMLPLAKAPCQDRLSQQQAFDASRADYHHERPNAAWHQTTPASHTIKSPRAMPQHMPQPDDAADAAARKVRSNGEIKSKGGACLCLAEPSRRGSRHRGNRLRQTGAALLRPPDRRHRRAPLKTTPPQHVAHQKAKHSHTYRGRIVTHVCGSICYLSIRGPLWQTTLGHEDETGPCRATRSRRKLAEQLPDRHCLSIVIAVYLAGLVQTAATVPIPRPDGVNAVTKVQKAHTNLSAAKVRRWFPRSQGKPFAFATVIKYNSTIDVYVKINILRHTSANHLIERTSIKRVHSYGNGNAAQEHRRSCFNPVSSVSGSDNFGEEETVYAQL